ncbi:hypothetical protein FHW67_000759 [Herbaspirillum sp. Sphag1AN]|nr:hypothetical protein [Herbaspirillum sp. Sphag1AN]MBB3245223.1 hypothetical protein [Herbaspirillum sp. Sphag64]
MIKKLHMDFVQIFVSREFITIQNLLQAGLANINA